MTEEIERLTAAMAAQKAELEAAMAAALAEMEARRRAASLSSHHLSFLLRAFFFRSARFLPPTLFRP